eukprot:g7149.t1
MVGTRDTANTVGMGAMTPTAQRTMAMAVTVAMAAKAMVDMVVTVTDMPRVMGMAMLPVTATRLVRVPGRPRLGGDHLGIKPGPECVYAESVCERRGTLSSFSLAILAVKGHPYKHVFHAVMDISDEDDAGPWQEGEKKVSKIVFIGKALACSDRPGIACVSDLRACSLWTRSSYGKDLRPFSSETEAKAAVQPGGRKPGQGGGGYYSSTGDAPQSGGGSYYDTHKATGGAAGGSSTMSSGYVASPGVRGGFHGSDAQRAHVEAMRRSVEESAPASMPPERSDARKPLSKKSLTSRRWLNVKHKRGKTVKAMSESSMKLLWWSELLSDLEVHQFGPRLRKRVQEVLNCPWIHAHPDKCPLPEAADATAILNAQRPPEMTEARPRAVPKATAKAPPAAAPPKAEAMPEADVEEAVPVAQRIRLCRSPLECFQVGEEVRLDPESGKDCCTPWCILLAAWHLISFLGAFCVFLMIMPLFAKQKPFIPMPKFVEGSYFPTAPRNVQSPLDA